MMMPFSTLVPCVSKVSVSPDSVTSRNMFDY